MYTHSSIHRYKYLTAPGPGWTATSLATCEKRSKADDGPGEWRGQTWLGIMGLMRGVIVKTRVASKSSLVDLWSTTFFRW